MNYETNVGNDKNYNSKFDAKKYLPFSMAIFRFRIIITSDLSKLGKYFSDNYFKFFKTFGVDFRNTINNNDRINTIRDFWFLL